DIGGARATAHVATLEAQRAAIADFRRAAQPVMAQTREQRDTAFSGSVMQRYAAVLTKINEVYTDLRRTIQTGTPALDPLIEIAGPSGEWGDNASRRSPGVGAGLYGQRQMRPEDVESFISADGALMAAWQRTQALVALQGNPPRLAEAMRHAR